MAVVVALVCAVGLLGGPVPAGAQDATDVSEPPTAADAAEAADEASEEVDVLTATREEVRRAVSALDRRYREQQAAVDAARQAAAEATEEAERARDRLDLARVEVAQARDAVVEYAVVAYIRPPAQDEIRVLSVDTADDAGFVSSVLRIMTEERHEVVGILVEKQEEAERHRAAADAALERARSHEQDAERQLVDLGRTREAQQDLAADLDARLDAALAEAAALAAIDQRMSEELVAQEVALHDEGPSSASAAPEPSPSTTAPPTSAAAGGGGGGAAAPAPAPAPAPSRPPTTRAPSPPPTSPPSPPSTGVTWSDVTSVNGIWVHRSIAGNVRALLDAASDAGLSLRGGGYRDPASQIATRRNNCGPTYYDIYLKPASQCTPPTAIPGRSMHERGLAIDFTSSGSLITSRSDPAFRWLASNASRYGLYNLPSEPWHWSTNGN